jgi:hypothetical protein
MLNRLRRSNQGSIENGFVLNFAGNLFGLFDDAVNCRTVDALRRAR